jgi:hypothetical protein
VAARGGVLLLEGRSKRLRDIAYRQVSDLSSQCIYLSAA